MIKQPPRRKPNMMVSCRVCCACLQHRRVRTAYDTMTFCPLGNPAGFTLIELIMVIAITGIIAATIGQLIGGQMASYQSLTERAALVQMAQSAIRRMEREIHRALPNSVVANGGTDIQLLSVVEGVRYRGAAYIFDSKTISFATQTSPIVVTTSVAHGFSTGDKVTIKDVYSTHLDPITGNPDQLIAFRDEENPWVITVIDDTTFSLDGSTAPADPYNTGSSGYTEKVLGDPLSFSACPDATFDLMGNLAAGTAGNIANLWMVVGNANLPGLNAWEGITPPNNTFNTQSNVATVSAFEAKGSDDATGILNKTPSDRLTITNKRLTDGSCAFPAESAEQRAYLVNAPIQFNCPGDGTLLRTTNYLPSPPYYADPTPVTTLLATQVAGCSFNVTYIGGNPPLVTISLTLTSPSGESVNITNQTSIDNGT